MASSAVQTPGVFGAGDDAPSVNSNSAPNAIADSNIHAQVTGMAVSRDRVSQSASLSSLAELRDDSEEMQRRRMSGNVNDNAFRWRTSTYDSYQMKGEG